MPSADPCVIVILGASGDLTHRKLVPALYEMNRRGAIDPRTRILSISRKDRGAILPVGRTRDAGVFWYVNDGRFTTSRWYADTLPAWLQAFNARRIPHRAAGTAWTLLRPAAAYAEPDSVPVESNGTDFAFPHVLPADTARATAAFAGDPRMDALTLDAVNAAVARHWGKGWTDRLVLASIGPAPLQHPR